MGIIKRVMFFGFGLPVRPTSKKDRLYRRQMGFEDPLGNLVSNIRSGLGGGRGTQDETTMNYVDPSVDARPRIPCPECAELILAEASVCRFCGATTRFQEKNYESDDNPAGRGRPAELATNIGGERREAEAIDGNGASLAKRLGIRFDRPRFGQVNLGSRIIRTPIERAPYKVGGEPGAVPVEKLDADNGIEEVPLLEGYMQCPSCHGSVKVGARKCMRCKTWIKIIEEVPLLEGYMQCPSCHGSVKVGARKCMHCRNWIKNY